MSAYERVKSNVFSMLRNRGIAVTSQIEESVNMLYNQLGIVDPAEIYQTLLLDYKTTHSTPKASAIPMSDFKSEINSINSNIFKSNSNAFNIPVFKQNPPVRNPPVYNPFQFGNQLNPPFSSRENDYSRKSNRLDDLRRKKNYHVSRNKLESKKENKPAQNVFFIPYSNSNISNISNDSNNSNAFSFQLINPFAKKEIKKIDEKSELTKDFMMYIGRYFETDKDFINLMKVSKQ